MFTVENSIVIDAPVDRVFAVDADPTKMPAYIPSVVEVDVPAWGDDPTGAVFRVRYGFAGMRFDSEAAVVGYQRNERFEFKAQGRVGEALQVNTYRPLADGATEVSWHLTFTPKSGLIARALAVAMRAELNASSFARDLRRLKAHCESDVSG